MKVTRLFVGYPEYGPHLHLSFPATAVPDRVSMSVATNSPSPNFSRSDRICLMASSIAKFCLVPTREIVENWLHQRTAS